MGLLPLWAEDESESKTAAGGGGRGLILDVSDVFYSPLGGNPIRAWSTCQQVMGEVEGAFVLRLRQCGYIRMLSCVLLICVLIPAG